MFGIGSTELLVILVVALIVLGPKSLAGVSRTLGKAMGEFRRVSTDFQRTLNAEVAEEEEAERRQKAKEKAEKTAEAVQAAKAARQEREAAQAKLAEQAEAPAAASAVPPPPDGSPLAEALAKSQAEANGVSSTAGAGKGQPT
ncbi:MAG: twin-arginine translocase subunit TatB [Desulfovibrio sp.]|nr:twin-arginine translocase subunit TatB [Desulfovibrio sp.]